MSNPLITMEFFLINQRFLLLETSIYNYNPLELAEYEKVMKARNSPHTQYQTGIL